jgi:hypothetical protein
MKSSIKQKLKNNKKIHFADFVDFSIPMGMAFAVIQSGLESYWNEALEFQFPFHFKLNPSIYFASPIHKNMKLYSPFHKRSFGVLECHESMTISQHWRTSTRL